MSRLPNLIRTETEDCDEMSERRTMDRGGGGEWRVVRSENQ